MINFVEYLQLPAQIAIVVIGVVFVMNLIGEILEFKGKVVPEFMKIRKYFSRKRHEKKETAQTLKEVKQLLGDVNAHYSADNITKRDNWMNTFEGIERARGEVLNILRCVENRVIPDFEI